MFNNLTDKISIEKFKELSTAKKVVVGAAGATAVGLGAYYLYKQSQKSVHFYDPGFDKNVVLYREEAAARSLIVSDVTYKLMLAFAKGDSYTGKVSIKFTLNNLEFEEKDFFIDFHGSSVRKFRINGEKLAPKSFFLDQRIQIPKAQLKVGNNVLNISFKNKYRKTGTGLHSFTDPIDKQQYIYSQFEPFHCHRAFPCFDQPDIKAKMTLMTLTPLDWISISNGIESVTAKKSDDESLYTSLCESYNLSRYTVKFENKEAFITIFDET